MLRLVFTSVLFCALVSSMSAQWIKQNVNTTASFRGLSIVSEKIVWASGTGGTVIRTVDGGTTWDVMTVPGAEKLDFRDIEAFDADTAYILSIGTGENSRIYKTVDGGKNWSMEFKNTNEKAFFDALACFDRENCLAVSDPVEGKFVLIRRSPGVNNRVGIRLPKWLPVNANGLDAKPGEAAFAASGTCLITFGRDNVFLVTGGNAARVFRSSDRGMTWSVADTPIAHGSAGSGIFSIAMRDDKNGVIVGGNYEKPDDSTDNLAFTTDGGSTWKRVGGLTGYRSAVEYIDNTNVIAAGTNGADISRDGGKSWVKLAGDNFNAVRAKSLRVVWAAGPKGMIANLK